MKQKKDFIEIAVRYFISALGLLLLAFAFTPFENNYVYEALHPVKFWNWLGFALLFAVTISPSGIWWAWLPEEKQPNVTIGLGLVIVGLGVIGAALMYGA